MASARYFSSKETDGWSFGLTHKQYIQTKKHTIYANQYVGLIGVPRGGNEKLLATAGVFARRLRNG